MPLTTGRADAMLGMNGNCEWSLSLLDTAKKRYKKAAKEARQALSTTHLAEFVT